jgi:hypothetical protein
MLGCNYAILYNERASDKILGLRGSMRVLLLRYGVTHPCEVTEREGG